MKDIYQLLREKELAIARLKKEVEALRTCIPLLSDSEQSMLANQLTSSSKQWPVEGEPLKPANPYQN
jgi:hypothetical protein